MEQAQSITMPFPPISSTAHSIAVQEAPVLKQEPQLDASMVRHYLTNHLNLLPSAALLNSNQLVLFERVKAEYIELFAAESLKRFEDC